MRPRTFYVYVLASTRSTVLYVGITSNLERRLHEHRTHADPCSFTTRYHVRRLIHAEAYPSAYEAIAREKQLKGWRREKKLALIRRTNPELEDLLPDPPAAHAVRAPLRRRESGRNDERGKR